MRRLFFIIALSISTAAMADMSPMTPTETQSIEATVSFTDNSQDFAQTDSDRQINKQIRDELSSGWFTKGYETITLKTNNGNVMIRGVVDSAKDAATVIEKVKNIDGVQSVDNRLEIKAQ